MYLDCPPLGWMLADAKKKCRVKKRGGWLAHPECEVWENFFKSVDCASVVYGVECENSGGGVAHGRTVGNIDRVYEGISEGLM